MNRRVNTTNYITRTGVLLALALVFQIGLTSLGQAVVGPLVNLVLIISAAIVGTLSGVVIGLFTPLIALFFGIMPPPVVPFIPFIMIGNALFVITFNLTRKGINKWGQYIGIVIAALFKFGFLALSARYLVEFITGKVLPQPIITAFSIPQLYTALVGGIIALIILRILPQNIYNQKGTTLKQ